MKWKLGHRLDRPRQLTRRRRSKKKKQRVIFDGGRKRKNDGRAPAADTLIFVNVFFFFFGATLACWFIYPPSPSFTFIDLYVQISSPLPDLLGFDQLELAGFAFVTYTRTQQGALIHSDIISRPAEYKGEKNGDNLGDATPGTPPSPNPWFVNKHPSSSSTAA